MLFQKGKHDDPRQMRRMKVTFGIVVFLIFLANLLIVNLIFNRNMLLRLFRKIFAKKMH